MRWQTTRLGDVVTLKRGHDLPESARLDGNIPVISSSGITGVHSEAKASGPGVITGRYGTLGQVFYVEEDYWPLNTALYVVDFKDNHPRFVAYLLENALRHYQSDKAAVPGIDRNVLHEVRVHSTARITQEAVVEILSAYDDLIENNRRRMVLLEEAARHLYHEWFVRLRFPGHEHTRITDGVPERWRRASLGDCSRFLSGGTPSKARVDFWEGEIPWVSSGELTAMRIDRTRLRVTEAAVESGSRLVPRGTILAVVRGMSLAKEFRIAMTSRDVAFNQDLKAIVSKPPVDATLLFYAIDSQREQICSQAGEASHGTKKLETAVLAAVPIVLPSATIQNLFVRQAAQHHAQWDNLDHQNLKLRAARDLLLPRLMSGDVAV